MHREKAKDRPRRWTDGCLLRWRWKVLLLKRDHSWELAPPAHETAVRSSLLAPTLMFLNYVGRRTAASLSERRLRM